MAAVLHTDRAGSGYRVLLVRGAEEPTVGVTLSEAIDEQQSGDG